MLQFDPTTGLSVEDISTVRERVRQEWITAFARDGRPELNTEPETPAGQLIDAQTAAIAEKDNELLYLGNMFNPLTASGIWQDALAKIYFLTRKQAQVSEATCRCTGLRGTVIAKGAMIRSSVDDTRWLAAETATIPAAGYVNMRFVSQATGEIAASADTLTEIVTVTPGWDAVTNPAAAVTGYDSETQAAFELRRYNSVAKNARGSMSAIYGALADLDNVVDVLVLENITNDPITSWGVEIPGHSIWATVRGGEDADIAETLYRKKDAGCGTAGNTDVTYQATDIPGQPIYTYKICRPDALAVGLKVTIRKTSDTPQDIEDKIKEAAIADFNGVSGSGNLRVGSGQYVYASRFYCPIISAGVSNLVSIEIAAPVSGDVWGDAITINANMSPVLDASDITVTMLDAE